MLSLLALGSAGCRSEKAVFVFAPGTGSFANPQPHTTAPAPVAAAELAAPQALAPAPPVAAAAEPLPFKAKPAARSQRAPLRFVTTKKAAGSPSAARAQASADRHPAERILLWSGVASTALGFILTYIGGNTVPISQGLLSIAHAFFWLGALLLIGWFVMLLLRASKE
ncbi:hypothetical protein [Hymenobacter saemangeumensis]